MSVIEIWTNSGCRECERVIRALDDAGAAYVLRPAGSLTNGTCNEPRRDGILADLAEGGMRLPLCYRDGTLIDNAVLLAWGKQRDAEEDEA